MITTAQIVVQVLGLSLCLFGAWGIYTPQKLMRLVKTMMDTDWAIYFAVTIRLAMGVALLAVAEDARFPATMEVLGWIAIAAAVTAAVIGRERLRKFTDWWFIRFSPPTIRLWALIAMAFGAFLIYGVS